MRSLVAPLWAGSLALAIALPGLCLTAGCSDQTQETGTSVTKPPGAAAAEKKSMEGMKAVMKDLAAKRKNR
jgi:hypothetical protein